LEPAIKKERTPKRVRQNWQHFRRTPHCEKRGQAKGGSYEKRKRGPEKNGVGNWQVKGNTATEQATGWMWASTERLGKRPEKNFGKRAKNTKKRGEATIARTLAPKKGRT